jgi:hypothetical protein
MKLIIVALLLTFTSCAVTPRYGVYRKVVCTDDRYGDLKCDNGQEYYRPYSGKSVYDY